MAFPANGATGVPTNIGVVVLSELNQFPASGVRVTDPAGTNIPIAPTTIPSPFPTGIGPYGPYEAVSVPTLAPATTYGVSQLVSESSTCSALFSLGSFTTQ